MSDFWTDLQRWTEAQVAAILRGRIGARRRDYLAADINKLLRDRIQDPLTIKVGNKVLAEFLSSHNRIPPTPVSPSPDIDHGWLFDSVIYVWSSLKAILAAKGWTFGASDDYATLVDRDEWSSALHPEDWSGLTRLLVQAWLGNARDPSDVLPTGWDLDLAPGRFGCIRSPGGVYWLVRLREMLGVEVSRLVVPDMYAQLAADLNAGTYVGDQALFVEATVMGALELPSTQDTVLLLESGQIGPFLTEWTSIYSEGYEECPWSWCFRYQKRGEADEELCGAVCVLHRSFATTWPQRTVEWREAVLEITFDGSGRPSASVSVEEQGWFQPVKHNFYTLKRNIPPSGITQNYLQLYLGDTEEITVVDTSSPLSEWGVVASCYGHDGQIQRVELIGRNKSTASSTGNAPGMPDNYNCCKSDSYQDDEHIGLATLFFAGNTIDDVGLSGSIRSENGTWSIQCPNATGSGSKTVTTNNAAIDCVLCGPGMVLLVGEIIAYTVYTTWTLSAGEDDFSCFCDGSDYDYTSAFTWQQAQIGGDYNDTEQITEKADGLTVLNHDTRWAFGASNAAYTWIKDILDDADPDPGAVVVVNYDSLAQSYGGQVNIAGAIYPAGLNATGAELDGKFCGGV